MQNEIKVGDWYVEIDPYSSYTLQKPRPRQIIEVTPTDVYVECGFIRRGPRFEHAVFKAMFRKLSKLECYLEGYESP